MIGLRRMVHMIDNLDLVDFPKSLLLKGEVGSGRHTLAKYISERYGIRYMEISDIFSKEVVESLYQEVIPTFYVIDVSVVDQKKQNILLKFLEEPTKNSFVIVISEYMDDILPTIESRCVIWTMEPYFRIDIEKLTTDERIIAVANTPGQVKMFEELDMDYYISLSQKLITSIHKASWPNLFAVVDKFDFEGKTLLLFSQILLNEFRTFIKRGGHLYTQYLETAKFVYQLKTIKNVDQRKLFETYLFTLKGLMS